jgi:hypothetical protein
MIAAAKLATLRTVGTAHTKRKSHRKTFFIIFRAKFLPAAILLSGIKFHQLIAVIFVCNVVFCS